MTAPTVEGLMDLVRDYGGYCHDELSGAARKLILLAIRAYAESLAATPPQPAGGQRLAVLATFAHEVLMGALYDPAVAAKLALQRTGLTRLDDVVALAASPQEPTEQAKPDEGSA